MPASTARRRHRVACKSSPAPTRVQTDRADRAALEELQPRLPRASGRPGPFPPGGFHPGLDPQRRRRAARRRDRGRGHPVPVPSQCAHHVDFAHGDSAVVCAPAGVSRVRPVDQHHDARRPGHCDRRAGGRRGRRRGEHPPAPRPEPRRRRDPQPTLQVVARRLAEVRSGIVYATIIVVLVFVPLFALPGIEGGLFAPLGIAYIVSILAAFSCRSRSRPFGSYLLRQYEAAAISTIAALVRRLKRGNRRLLAVDFRPDQAW